MVDKAEIYGFDLSGSFIMQIVCKDESGSRLGYIEASKDGVRFVVG